MTAPWAPEAEVERLSPARAAACRDLAGRLGFVYACPVCARNLLPGAVLAYMTRRGLEEHLAEFHEGEG